MKIKGLIESSFLDWDGKLVVTVFLGGCNFRCGYCHGRELLDPNNLPDIPFRALEDIVTRQRGWLDGIVVSGGEPTTHPDLPQFLSRIKGLGLPVKLDTNGSNHEMVRQILEAGLVDYVAMDVKAPLVRNGQGSSRGSKERSTYQRVAGCVVDIENIMNTVRLLIQSGVEHEFRTTVTPPVLTGDDIVAIAKDLLGAKRYVLQQFNPAYALDPALRDVMPYDRDELHHMVSISREHVPLCFLRGEQTESGFPARAQAFSQPVTDSALLGHAPEAEAAVLNG